MKPRAIRNLQLVGWLGSWLLTAVGGFSANGAGADAVDAAEVEKTDETPNRENPETAAQDPAEPQPNQSPLEDFAPPGPVDEVPLAALADQGPIEDVPNTLPVVASIDDPLAFVTPEVAEDEDSGLAADPAEIPAFSWPSAPGAILGQPGIGFGNGNLPTAPSGFTSSTPSLPMGRATGFLEGFSVSSMFSATYDSNVNPGGWGGAANDSQDDFILSLGGGLSYMSKAKDWTFGGNYSGGYNQYLNQSDFSGFNQGFGLVGHFDGAKLDATLSLDGGVEQGTNRYYQSDFVEQTNVNVGFDLSYQYSPKTSFQASYGQRFTVAGGNEYNDTASFDLSVAALWRYSKLTQFGPGIRYSIDTSGGEDSRTSIAPEFLFNYKLSSKVSLNSRVGVEFSQYESGASSDPAIIGSLGLNYAASKLWGMNLSVFSGTQPDPSATGSFTQVNSIQLGYHRRMRRANLGLGISYAVDSTQGSDDDAPSSISQDGDSLNFNASLGMPVFANTCAASVFLGYNKETGGSQDSWDSTRAGFSISRSF